MYRYLVKRLLLVIPTLFGAAALVFFLMRLIPGDVCLVRLGAGGATVTAQALHTCHVKLGLDKPLWLQFVLFIWGLFHFNLGISLWSGYPVSYEIATRFPITLEIAIFATVLSIMIAVPAGTISAIKQNSWTDFFVRTFAISGIAMPSFWLGIMTLIGVLNLSQYLTGREWMPPISYIPLLQHPLENLSAVFLPAITVGYQFSAVVMRMTRSAMLEVLREDYIRTARAKGLIERIIINRHALKNSMLPVVTVIGIQFAFLIGGLVVTEQVFNINGLGRLLVEAVQNEDYTLTQGIVLLVVTVFILTNLIIDIVYAWLDPRIRYA